MPTLYKWVDTYIPWRESLLVSSLLFTTATQLRLQSIPVGVGEIGLVFWLILFIYVLGLRQFKMNRLVVWYGVFWLVSLPSLMLGAVIASGLGEATPLSKYIRELVALVFVVILCLVLTIETGTIKDSIGRTSRLIRYTSFFTLLVVVFAGFGIDFMAIQWWLGTRFQGFSANPNQFALLLLPMPFFIMYLGSVIRLRLMYFIMGLLIGVVGLATGSDALILAWIAGIGFYVLCNFHGRISVILLVPLYLFLLASIAVVMFLLSLDQSELGIQNVLSSVYGSSSEQYVQSFRRFDLWSNGLIAGMDSPLFGLGPGNHSGFDGPHQDSEAHNSFIDWFTISGVIGVLAFLALIATQFRFALRSSPWLASTMVALLVFCSFHYMFRHPLFWFYLILIGQLSIREIPVIKWNRKNLMISSASSIK